MNIKKNIFSFELLVIKYLNMKNLKQLSRSSLKNVFGGDFRSSCSTKCANGKSIATVNCAGGCTVEDGKWAGCSDSSHETAVCPNPKPGEGIPETPSDSLG
ncbi:bacteriocin-like protein [Elizabethkingia anophelis]|uniref:bacteriocin-like protein n=1 Tax=Elizabethkingia anophelis TaxID=1117645 RepID=UPI001EEFAC3D|nr:hypothetical protein [Elizabethkingia anophelis]MCL1690752.1 hypothetical protein [Elizabethkingia anophelis]